MNIQEVIDALTNGVGEKPYYRRIDGRMVVFVADDQEVLTVSTGGYEGLDKEIAEAICEASLMLKQLQAEKGFLKKVVQIDVHLLGDIRDQYSQCKDLLAKIVWREEQVDKVVQALAANPEVAQRCCALRQQRTETEIPDEQNTVD